MTAQLFQCLACGAPIVPKGRASIISCPYCRASVVVPEGLRQGSGAAQWSTLLYDAFARNDHHWLVGPLPSEYFTRLDRTIAEGRYRWEAQVGRPASITPSWLMGYPVSDFHLKVNGKHIRGSRTGSSWGVVFRIQDNHSYHWFRITDTQFFAASATRAGQWGDLVAWTRTDTIKPDGVNQVEVIAQEKHLTFLINGQVVSEVEEDAPARPGLVGLAIEGYTPGDEMTFDFLDITLRAP